jgi:hypothetical protein
MAVVKCDGAMRRLYHESIKTRCSIDAILGAEVGAAEKKDQSVSESRNSTSFRTARPR